MNALQETTKWDCPNHTYLVDGSKVHAYIIKGTKTPVYFSKPMTFDRRGRTFKEIRATLFKVLQKSNLIEVKGSRGDTYFVDPVEKTCTCPGFKFHGKCKHLNGV